MVRFLAILMLFTTSLFPSIIKKPPVKQLDVPYKELVYNEQDQKDLNELIAILSENNKINILLNKSYLNELGAKLDHVHPLKFLSAILIDSKLKEGLQEIWTDYFKRNGFLDGINPKLNQEMDQTKLMPYLEPFAEEVQGNPIVLKPFFDKRDWEGMIYYLIQS